MLGLDIHEVVALVVVVHVVALAAQVAIIPLTEVAIILTAVTQVQVVL